MFCFIVTSYVKLVKELLSIYIDVSGNRSLYIKIISNSAEKES